jgi:hypothetical protein
LYKIPRLSIAKRSRLIAIYYQYDLEITKKKYDRLFELALEELNVYLKVAGNENYCFN